MPSPLLFFIFIIVIDLVLKTSKDKKKAEQSRQKTTPVMQNQPLKPIKDLKRVLERELEKERQRENEKPQDKINISQATNSKAKEVMADIRAERNPWDNNKDKKNTSEIIKPTITEVKNKKDDFKKDILRGIIFSEILSEPKSIQNQKRSS